VSPRRSAILVLTCAALALPPVAAPAEPSPPSTVADSLFALSDWESVLTLVPEPLREASARGDSTLVGALHVVRGRALFGLGDARGAEAALRLAAGIAEAQQDTVTWQTALGFLGLTLGVQGRWGEALAANERRLVLATATHNAVSEAWARVGIAYVLLLQGDYDPAREHYARAAEFFRAQGMRREELSPLVGLARMRLDRGEIDAAREAYRRVLQVAREIGDPDQEGHALNNLGTLEFVHGDMAVAAAYFERAYALRLGHGDYYEAITPASNVARARVALGQLDDAARILLDAEQVCVAQGYADLLAVVLNEVGTLRLAQERPGAAAAVFRRTLALGEALTHVGRDEAILGLGTALMLRDSCAAAIPILEGALAARNQVRVVDRTLIELRLARCLRAVGRADAALPRALAAEASSARTGDRVVRPVALAEVSQCYRAVGRLDEAERACREAIEAFAAGRGATSEEIWREAIGQATSAPLVDACRVLFEHPPGASPDERNRRAYDAIQRFKARTLIERITDPRRRGEGETALAAAGSIALGEVQESVLRPGEVALDLATGRDATLLFAITRDTCVAAALPGLRSPLAAKVALFRSALARAAAGSPSRYETTAMQRALGTAILGDVAGVLAGASRIYVIPDAYLAAIPWGALVPPGDTEPLLARAEVVTVPSMSALAFLRERSRQRRPTGETAMLVLAPPTEAALAGIAREVRYLRSRFEGVEVARGLPGGAAGLALAAAGCGVLHIAAHAEANDEKPWQSSIDLGGPGAASDDGAPAGRGTRYGVDDGGLLRASDIAALRLGTRLAVLSGCETASGRATSGEGVLGLTSAFMSAGVPATVATLWPVEDRATARMMTRFYDALGAGADPAAALRAAALAERSRGGQIDASLWAAFVLVGAADEPVALSLRANPGWPPMVLLLGILAPLVGVALALAWLRRRRRLDYR